MTIKDLVKKAHKNAKEHGFWEDWQWYLQNTDVLMKQDLKDFTSVNDTVRNNAIGNRLMLIVSEVAEAHDALRKGHTEHIGEEIADICIRCFDLAGGLGINFENEILEKMEKNRSRPYKHGKKL